MAKVFEIRRRFSLISRSSGAPGKANLYQDLADGSVVETVERTGPPLEPSGATASEKSDDPQRLEERRAEAHARVIRLKAFVQEASKELRARNYVLPDAPSYRF